MKVKFSELTKEEIQEVTNMYIEERENLYDITSLEEFVEGLVRRCECCKELVMVDEFYSELPVMKNWKGEECHCCESCLEEMEESV